MYLVTIPKNFTRLLLLPDIDSVQILSQVSKLACEAGEMPKQKCVFNDELKESFFTQHGTFHLRFCCHYKC